MKFLETAIYDLLQSEPYYAHFVLESRIVYDRFGVATAGASVVNGTPMLVFNTEFMAKLSRAEVAAILKHEILHLLLLHGKRANDKYDRQSQNIAMDCAINQYIEDVPDGCVNLKQLEEFCGQTLLPFETFEYYHSKMVQAAKDSGNLKTVDDHDLEIPGEETNEDMAKAAVKTASDKALNSAKGVMPNNLDKVLGALGQAKLNWKSILRNFISRNISSTTQLTRKKIHRRFEWDQPGKKKKRELTLGVCIDCSGSVSDESIQQFYAEISSMLPSISKAWIVQADCVVQHVELATKNTKLVATRKGAGGTAYGPALAECVAKKCDAIAYLGDLDCADVPENPGIPVLWCTVGSETRPGNFGAVVRLS